MSTVPIRIPELEHIEDDKWYEYVSAPPFSGAPVIFPWVDVGENVTLGFNSVIGVLPRPPHNTTVTEEMLEPKPATIGDNVTIGNNVVIYCGIYIWPNAYIADLATVREKSYIGRDAIVGRGVTVEPSCCIGAGSRIEDNAQITPGAVIQDDVFIGPGVEMTNDKYMGRVEGKENWYEPVTVKRFARVGANATLLPGITIGEDAVIGGGSVVTKDVPPREIWIGNPARFCKKVPEEQLAVETSNSSWFRVGPTWEE